MRLSNLIEEFIKEMLSAQNGEAELKRNELATKFNCVPSQINYVISTRFSPERGYSVESRRGGGGYIRITQVVPDDGNHVMQAVNIIGDHISYDSAKAILQNFYGDGIITQREAKIILAALSDTSIPVRQPERDILRAGILKNVLLTIIS